MNFQDLKKVESATFYIDVAFRRASKKAKELRSRVKKNRFQKSKELELARIQVIRDVLTSDLNDIIKGFPSLDSLDQFYIELIKCTLDYKDIKKSLGSVKWAVDKINQLFKKYYSSLTKTQDIKKINPMRREYYGRVSSVVKQIDKYLEYLETARRTMRKYPAVKTKIFTVCIFGFPNSGKSTLLSKLTQATPEIAAYPFTTKQLNLGYIKEPPHEIQIIDTPGTLNRFNKMNDIELQAYIAVKHLADLVVYVFDPQFSYDFEKQKKLLERVKKFNKPVLLYLSKTDIVPNAKEKFKDFQVITDIDELKEKIKASQLQLNKK